MSGSGSRVRGVTRSCSNSLGSPPLSLSHRGNAMKRILAAGTALVLAFPLALMAPGPASAGTGDGPDVIIGSGPTAWARSSKRTPNCSAASPASRRTTSPTPRPASRSSTSAWWPRRARRDSLGPVVRPRAFPARVAEPPAPSIVRQHAIVRPGGHGAPGGGTVTTPSAARTARLGSRSPRPVNEETRHGSPARHSRPAEPGGLAGPVQQGGVRGVRR